MPWLRRHEDEEVHLFGRVRIDRIGRRARDRAAGRRDDKAIQRAIKSLERQIAKEKDPKKKAQFEKQLKRLK